MINEKVWLSTPTRVSQGLFNIILYFQNSQLASYVMINDEVIDTAGNKYYVSPSNILPYSDGGTLGVISSEDILPVEDSDYLSIISTPKAFDPKPRLKTTGLIDSVSVYDSTKYEYSAMFNPDDGATALKAIVGDKITDLSGKEFEITFISPLGFTDFIRLTEVELQGLSPSQGIATLYSQTGKFGFYQGIEFDSVARLNIQNRDFKKIDKILPSNVDIFDSTLTELPVLGSQAIVDNDQVTNNSVVMFSNLTTNKGMYRAICDNINNVVEWRFMYNDFDYGDKIYVKRGKTHFELNMVLTQNSWQPEDKGITILVAGEDLRTFDPIYISAGDSNGDVGRVIDKVYLYELDNYNRNNLAGIVESSSLIKSGEKVRIRSSDISSPSNISSNYIMSPIWATNKHIVAGSEKAPFYINATTNFLNPMESCVGTLLPNGRILVNITNKPSHMKQYINLPATDDVVVLFSPNYGNISSIEYDCLATIESSTSSQITNAGKLVVVKEGSSYVANFTFIGTDIGFRVDVDQTTGDIYYVAPISTVSEVKMLRIIGNDFRGVNSGIVVDSN